MVAVTRISSTLFIRFLYYNVQSLLGVIFDLVGIIFFLLLLLFVLFGFDRNDSSVVR